MSGRDNEKISPFEKYLLEQIKEASAETRFLSEEKLDQPTAQPEELNSSFVDRLVSVMEDAHARRSELKRKLEDFSRIKSLGELIRVYFEYNNIPSSSFAKYLAFSSDELQRYLRDSIHPQTLGIHRILTLVAFIGISLKEMLDVLDRTTRLIKIKTGTKIAQSHARSDKGMDEATRHDVLNDAMKELLLAVDNKEQDKPTEEWENFKNDLIFEAKKDSALISMTVSECLLIDVGLAKSALHQLLEHTESDRNGSK